MIVVTIVCHSEDCDCVKERIDGQTDGRTDLKVGILIHRQTRYSHCDQTYAVWNELK